MHIVFKKKEKRKGLHLFHVVALLTIATFVLSFINSEPQEPTYKVSLTLSGWQNMVDCLKKSTAESVRTNALIDEIGKQIDPILIQEQKVQDSLNKLKVKPKQ